MPIYEYLCNACEHKMEALQKMGDHPLKDCPRCGQESLRKLISAAAFRLKGEGWYETDFKGDKDQQLNLSKSDDKPAVKEAKTDSAKDTAKPKPDSSKSDNKASEQKPQPPAGDGNAKKASG